MNGTHFTILSKTNGEVGHVGMRDMIAQKNLNTCSTVWLVLGIPALVFAFSGPVRLQAAVWTEEGVEVHCWGEQAHPTRTGGGGKTVRTYLQGC